MNPSGYSQVSILKLCLNWTSVGADHWAETLAQCEGVTRFSLLQVTKRFRWIWVNYWWVGFPKQLFAAVLMMFCSSQRIWRNSWILEKRPWNEGLKRFKRMLPSAWRLRNPMEDLLDNWKMRGRSARSVCLGQPQGPSSFSNSNYMS